MVTFVAAHVLLLSAHIALLVGWNHHLARLDQSVCRRARRCAWPCVVSAALVGASAVVGIQQMQLASVVRVSMQCGAAEPGV
jgi:hypothetical protein